MDTFNPSQMPPLPNQDTEKKSSVGPLIAVIIILVLIIVGGLYFLKERAAQQIYVPTQTEQQSQEDAMVESFNQQSDSDELDSIESDLNNTDIDNADQGSMEIEAEIEAQANQ
jgi:hypothetical protein